MLVRGFLEVAAVVGEVTGCFKVLAVEGEVAIEGGHYGLEEGSKGGRAGNRSRWVGGRRHLVRRTSGWVLAVWCEGPGASVRGILARVARVGDCEAAVAEKNGRRIVANARNAKAVRREESDIHDGSCELKLRDVVIPAVTPVCGPGTLRAKAIWMASSLPSLDVLGIACEVGQLGDVTVQSVKRTVSGSSSG